MKFVVAEKKGPHGLLIVISDENLIGLFFEEGELQLDLSKPFYQGTKKNKAELVSIIKTAQHIHFTGKEAITLGLGLNLIKPKNILYVAGIPHAEMTSF